MDMEMSNPWFPRPKYDFPRDDSKVNFQSYGGITEKSQQNKRISKNFDVQLPMAFRIYFAFHFIV